ncbi:MAG TPA: chemotaxis protein CheA [Nitrospirota bacterium]|nr:chemotaxis protein CheA [Nitrospirota bacterium]
MGKTDRSIKDFLGEAEDVLEAANESLLALETARTEGRSDPDQVNSLFRAIHSFKGLSGMFGLDAPQQLSHKLEFLLDELRLGRAALTVEALAVLADTIAVLGRLVQQAGQNRPFEATAPAVERIDTLLHAKPVAEPEHPLAALINIDAGILQVLTEYEEHRLRECIRERKNLFLLKADFDFGGFEAGIKDLNAVLKKHGEIICTLPTAGASGIGFTIVIGTGSDRGAVAAAVSSVNVVISTIEYREAGKGEEHKIESSALRSVSNTVRVDIYKLDSLMHTVGEMHLIKNVVSRIAKELKAADGMGVLAVDLYKAQRALERKLNELQDGILDVRMVPIGQIFSRLSQLVKKYAREAGKEINLELFGDETELDKLMMEDLADPLMHLIRNAIDHGIEPMDVRRSAGKQEQGTVRLTAYPKGNHVVIAVEDDGAGIDPSVILARAERKGLVQPGHGLHPDKDQREIFELIFLPGFTTSDQVTEISGRGVGMDVVKRNVARLSGMIDIQTEPGQGTAFLLTLPITLAIIKALIIESGGQTFAIPLSAVLEILQASEDRVETVEGREVMAVRGDTIPLLRLRSVFNLPYPTDHAGGAYVILVGLAERRLGIIVETIHDQQEIVIKPLGKRLADVHGIAGATELGDRRGVVLVLDVESLIEGAFRRTQAAKV